MLDRYVRRLIDPPLEAVARRCVAAGLGANQVTWAGFVVGLLALPCLAFGLYLPALMAILFSRVADGLDGAIARLQGPTDLGGYLDIVLDFIFYSSVPFGFALGKPEVALAAAFLIFSFIGTGASFLAYASIAAKRGLSTEMRGRKSLYYLGGLTEGTETIAALSLMCVWPAGFMWLAVGFGLLCWLTTATRIAAAMADFRDPPSEKDR